MPVSKHSLIFQLHIQQRLIRKQQTGLKTSETGICTFSLQATEADAVCSVHFYLWLLCQDQPHHQNFWWQDINRTWHKWWKTNYRQEVKQPTTQCYNNNLSLNGKKAKQLVGEFKKGCRVQVLLIINKVCQRVGSTKFVSSTSWLLSSDLNWPVNPTFFDGQARPALPAEVKWAVHVHGTAECILTYFIAVCYENCIAANCKLLQRIVHAAEKITGICLSTTADVYTDQ